MSVSATALGFVNGKKLVSVSWMSWSNSVDIAEEDHFISLWILTLPVIKKNKVLCSVKGPRLWKKRAMFLSKTVNQHKTQPKLQTHQYKWDSIWLWAELRSQTKHYITVSCPQQNKQKLIFTWKSFIICRCLVCKQYKTETLESPWYSVMRKFSYRICIYHNL